MHGPPHEGSWCPCPEGWVTQGGPPELGGSWGQGADSLNLWEETWAQVSAPGHLLLLFQPPPLVPAPQPASPYTHTKLGQQKALWKPSLNRVTPASKGPWKESHLGPENPLVLTGQGMSVALVGIGERHFKHGF